MGLLSNSLKSLLSAQRTPGMSMVRHASTKIEPNGKWFLYAIPPCAFIIVFLLPSYTPSQINPIKKPGETFWKEPLKGDEGHAK